MTEALLDRPAAAPDALDGRLLPVRLGSGTQRRGPRRAARQGGHRGTAPFVEAVPENELPCPPPPLTAKQAEVLRQLRQLGRPVEQRELTRLAEVRLRTGASAAGSRDSPGSHPARRPGSPTAPRTRSPEDEPVTLNDDQQRAWSVLEAAVAPGRFPCASCCTASPAAARRRFICAPSRKWCGRARRRWCWCRKSA